MKRLLPLAFLLAACGAPHTEQETPAAATEAAAPATVALSVADAWANPTPGGVNVSAGYLTITNDTETADRLVSASSPRASSVEVHEMTMDGGVMRMRHMQGGIAIPAGGAVMLAPGGYHLMFMGVTQPFAEGEEIPVQLTFETAGVKDIVLQVRRAGAPPAHDMHTTP